MKKGMIPINLLVTVIIVIVVVVTIFAVWGVFKAEAGKTTSNFFYRLIDAIFGG